MVASRTRIALIAALLMLLGMGLALYKVFALGFPIMPGESRDVWTIESMVSFKPGDGPLDVRLRLPEGEAGWVVLDEHFASSGFGFSVMGEQPGRHARWTRAQLEQPTTLYYKMQTYRLRDTALDNQPPPPVEPPSLEADQAAAMARLVAELQAASSGPQSLAVLAIQAFSPRSNDQEASFLLSTWEDAPHTAVLALLAHAGIPAREMRGIRLEDGRRRQRFSSLLEIHDGSRWVVLDPTSAQAGIPQDFFVWQRGPDPVLEVIGGRDSRLEFALVSNSLPARSVVSMERRAGRYALLDFSIYSLPVEQQGVFKGLLLIPVAALVVVIMRVLIGLKTSGTFMPILIALAFIQTTLLLGLAIFLVLVGVGLWIRSWLSHMNLLLTARISAVVIVVIFLMAAMAIGSYKLGLDQVLTVTFFPTIILAWTIERMSILWEEEGPHEVLVQGGGSLAVAVLAYLAMSNALVAHLTFNFPELTLSLLSVILLLGKYTGYRLTELYRFRDVGENP